MEAVLLDTDVFSFLGKEDHKIGALYRKHVRNKRVAISFVTVGEVLSGAKKGNWSPALHGHSNDAVSWSSGRPVRFQGLREVRGIGCAQD